jgi:hypothetical protein
MDAEFNVFDRRRTALLARPLPRQQQRVMDFIMAEVAAGRRFPGARAIADHMGWKQKTGARDVLSALVYKGRLTRSRVDGEWTFAIAEAAP